MGVKMTDKERAASIILWCLEALDCDESGMNPHGEFRGPNVNVYCDEILPTVRDGELPELAWEFVTDGYIRRALKRRPFLPPDWLSAITYDAALVRDRSDKTDRPDWLRGRPPRVH